MEIYSSGKPFIYQSYDPSKGGQRQIIRLDGRYDGTENIFEPGIIITHDGTSSKTDIWTKNRHKGRQR